MIEAQQTRQDILDAIHRRRAVRAYTDQQPRDALIGELIDAAVQAPTAMHREPWAFAVVQVRDTLKRYSDQAKQMLLRSETPVGWGSVGGSASHEHLAAFAAPDFNIFYDASTLIVVCRTETSHFADADCWLAAENLMLAAAARGLGTCCIGLAVPVLNTAEVKRELGIPEQGAAVAPLIVGYPRGAVPRVSRRAPTVLSWLRP